MTDSNHKMANSIRESARANLCSYKEYWISGRLIESSSSSHLQSIIKYFKYKLSIRKHTNDPHISNAQKEDIIQFVNENIVFLCIFELTPVFVLRVKNTIGTPTPTQTQWHTPKLTVIHFTCIKTIHHKKMTALHRPTFNTINVYLKYV